MQLSCIGILVIIICSSTSSQSKELPRPSKREAR